MILVMETRRERSNRDARGIWLSRKELAYALLAAPAALGAQFAIQRRIDVPGFLIAVLAVVLAYFLIPVGVYVGSWLTAATRIHHDELIALRAEVERLRAEVEGKREASELVGKLKELRSFAGILNQRVPPWGDTPAGLDAEVDAWAARVSAALAEQPELQQQFDHAPEANAALTALNASALSQKLSGCTTVLDAIIKHLSGGSSKP